MQKIILSSEFQKNLWRAQTTLSMVDEISGGCSWLRSAPLQDSLGKFRTVDNESYKIWVNFIHPIRYIFSPFCFKGKPRTHKGERFCYFQHEECQRNFLMFYRKWNWLVDSFSLKEIKQFFFLGLACLSFASRLVLITSFVPLHCIDFLCRVLSKHRSKLIGPYSFKVTSRHRSTIAF